jgi:hypothetical protein
MGVYSAMKRIVFLLIFFFNASLFSHVLLLINDSSFELTAIIHASNGVVLGQMVLKPGEQKRWSTSMGSSNTNEIYRNSTSNTPLYVVWKCGFQGYYSICSDVSSGATITASSGSGSKSCTKKPTDKEKEEMYCPTCPSCPLPPSEEASEPSEKK